MSENARSDWALIPNWLSAGRIVAALILPLMFLAFPQEQAEVYALALFVGASLTDFFDGWLARALNQTSALGAKLDSWADKALLFTTLAALSATLFRDQPLFWLAAFLSVAREVGVTWLRARFGRAGALSVSNAAKWKTVFQMTSAAILLGVGPTTRWFGETSGETVYWAGLALFLIGFWLSLSSGVGYLRGALRASGGS